MTKIKSNRQYATSTPELIYLEPSQDNTLTMFWLFCGSKLLITYQHEMACIYDNKYKNMTSAYRGYAAFTQVTKASHVITDHTLLFGWLLLLFGTVFVQNVLTWWRHQMEAFSALLDLHAGNSPVTGEFPAQRPVTRSFDVFFDLHLNKRLRKQSLGCWLWRHYDVTVMLCATGGAMFIICR